MIGGKQNVMKTCYPVVVVDSDDRGSSTTQGGGSKYKPL